MPGLRFLLRVFLVLFLFGVAAAQALEVRQVVWGFDGRVIPGRFNPVSFLMVNSRPGAFDGRITLSPTLGFGGERGARYIQNAFIGPQSSRWVQFEVFIGNDMEEFVLSWGPGPKDRETFDRQIQTGPPACVWLVDANDPLAKPGAFKSFPDQLFPTTVSATDGLDSVILDYTPRWEPARREAFLDWIRRGGTLHLVHGTNGELPVFSDTLAVLNRSCGIVCRARTCVPPRWPHGAFPRGKSSCREAWPRTISSRSFSSVSPRSRGRKSAGGCSIC
jgi:hypothetical protein